MLPQDFFQANLRATASALPSKNLLGALSQRPRAEALFLPPTTFGLCTVYTKVLVVKQASEAAHWPDVEINIKTIGSVTEQHTRCTHMHKHVVHTRAHGMYKHMVHTRAQAHGAHICISIRCTHRHKNTVHTRAKAHSAHTRTSTHAYMHMVHTHAQAHDAHTRTSTRCTHAN